ncbi:MAG TPA: hypothetical protein VF487_12155 [Chitinophagaceae bacterium]
MKRLLSIIAITAVIAVLVTACSRSKGVSEAAIKYEDTAGFSQFQAWKAVNEQADPTQSYNQGFVEGYQQAVTKTPARKATTAKHSTPSASQSGTMTSTSSSPAKVKKGMSKSAKYAIVGGVAGGVAGAVINKKNRAVGGIVGAVLGAGGGYVLGRTQDKKDGRF